MTIEYACVGGPPDNWNDLVVIDLATGEEVETCVEAAPSWAVRYVTPLVACDGVPSCAFCEKRVSEHLRAERIEGRFEIRVKDAEVRG